MQTQVVGFFTEQSAQLWFFEYGDQVEILAKKTRTPQGDGSPHLIIKTRCPDELLNTIYPEGMVMENNFEEYDGACPLQKDIFEFFKTHG